MAGIPRLKLGRVLLVMVASLAVGGAASAEAPPASRLVAPWVHQKGTGFVDARGRTVLLRGVNATSDQAKYFGSIVTLHANLVRIPVKWSLLEPGAPQGGVHSYDPAGLASLDAQVGFFLRNHINVLLDFHQSHWSSYFQQTSVGKRPNPNDQAGIPSWLYTSGLYPPTGTGRTQAVAAFYTDQPTIDLFSSFARMIVDRYRSYPNVVGYEILNEPQTGSLPSTHATTQMVVAWEAKILPVIRAEDPLRTVFFMLRGGGNLGYKQADISAFKPLKNLALDLHDYFAGNTGNGYTADGEDRSATFARTSEVAQYGGSVLSQRAYLLTVLARTQSWNIPLLIGEWGARRDDPNRLLNQSHMLTLFGSLKLSWTRWNLDRYHQFGILGPGGALTDAGDQLRRYLVSTPSTIAPVKPKPPALR